MNDSQVLILPIDHPLSDQPGRIIPLLNVREKTPAVSRVEIMVPLTFPLFLHPAQSNLNVSAIKSS
jgi:hypothetical protein